jgi:predicted enzyme related to lactoylglutathione lyase
MSSVHVSSESATGSSPVKAGEVRFEVVVVPVSDVDRATRFYETLPAPGHADYGSFAAFSDPDGNGWLLQEIKARLPGR